MAFTAKAGKNGLIYVSGTEIFGANAWSINVEHESIAYTKFGDEWQSVFSGIKSWAGSVSALHDQDSKVLETAAAYDGTCALLIYPDRLDQGTYYSGNAIFAFGSEAGMTAAVGQTASYTGSGTLTLTGFS